MGHLSAVNPGYSAIDGIPCYPNLQAVPHPVDLVLIFVPAPKVAGLIEEAGRVGCQVAIVFSSGFAEAGPVGAALQKELTEAVARSGVRVLGPNCQGAVHLPTHLVATFSSALTGSAMPPPGPFAYLGQSGAVGGAFFDLASARGVCPSTWVSTGNQADIDVTAAGRALLEEQAPALICIYLESVPSKKAWTWLLASAAAAGSRVAVLRSGRSSSGKRAAASHTGAMVGPEQAFDLVCAENGVLIVEEIDELVDLAVGLPASRGGRRIGVITSSGGAGCILVDIAESEGIAIPELSEGTQAQLAELVPSFGALANPVDVTAQLFNDGGQDFAQVCEIVASDPNIDQVVVLVTNIVGDVATALADSLTRVTPRLKVPLSVVYLAAHARTQEARTRLGAHGIPVFDSGRSAVRAILRLTQPTRRSAVTSTAALVLPPLPAGLVVTEAGGTALLDAVGVPRPAGRLVFDGTEARKIAEALGSAVVLKAQSAELIHKSEHGGVRVGVALADVESVFDDVVLAVRRSNPNMEFEGILVQSLAGAGVELLVGCVRRDGDYPPVLTVGMGGTATELYADVASALAPLSKDAALELMRRLKGFPLLAGYRGSPPADIDAAAEAVASISQLAVALGTELAELEVNPLIVHPVGLGVTAADFILVRAS